MRIHLRQIIPKLRSLATERSRVIVLAVIGLFVFSGIAWQLGTRAAGPFIAAEAEQGTPAGCAQTAPDTGASGGQAISFTDCGSQTQTVSSVTQYGMTWNFSSPKTVGQFANGDWWVLGPVTITGITPNFDTATGSHGWQVNPPLTANDPLIADESVGGQSFDRDGAYYQASMMPALPYAAQPGASIVKAISLPKPNTTCTPSNTRSCLRAAAVLTVLGTIPPDNGATVFRPPYTGTDKPLYSTADIEAQLAVLPRLASTANIDNNLPSQQSAYDNIKRMNLVHVEEVSQFYPEENVGMTNPYAPGVSNIYTDGIMRALIVKSGDSEPLRRQTVIAAIQRGIDTHGARAMGMHWYAAGGTNYGMRLPTVFAAFMLNNQSMKDLINSSTRNDFAETGSIWPNKKSGGQPVWGQDRGGETSYWQAVDSGNDTNTTWDPYFYIDGGALPGETYQQCCNAGALKSDSLVVHLIPGLKAVWNDQLTLDFVERWVTVGTWAQPDPCAPRAQGGGPNPAKPGECILDPDLTAGSTFMNFSCQAGKLCGRAPERQGVYKDNSGWGSDLTQAAWPVYRSRW